MEVERAVVDLYRTFMMKDRVGERFEGTVTAVVGSGMFVQLDAPFVDVLVRLEDMGEGHWEIDDDGLRIVAARSGDVVALGDRVGVEITDAAILRRTVYARRVGGGEERRGREGRRKHHEPPPQQRGKPRKHATHPKYAAKHEKNDRNRKQQPKGRRKGGKFKK
jgi:ribonuclease R